MHAQDLPADLARYFAGEQASFAAADTAFGLVTTGEDGWPHQALLSVGEVLAVPPQRLRLAIWEGTTTARNLLGEGKALLTGVLDGTAYLLWLRCADLGAATVAGGELRAFDATVNGLREDRAPYAALESGVRFSLHDPSSVHTRWVQTLAWLRTRR